MVRPTCKYLMYALFLALVLGSANPLVRADFPAAKESHRSKPYPAVEITALVFSDPRPLRVWAVQIDLTSPDIDFMVTPRGKLNDKGKVIAVTTLDFAKAFNVQIGINGTPFSPVPIKPGEGVDILGLSISQGDRYSEAHRLIGALVIDAKRQAALLPAPITPGQLKGIVHGVGGQFPSLVLAKGKNLHENENKPGANASLHPRTAVGLSADGKTMWWLIVDGRQKPRSEGVNHYELAELGRSVGCHDLLNFDGGGSTTLVVQDRTSGAHKVVNTPVGLFLPGTLRWNGNNLGLYVFTPDRAVPSAPLKAIMPTLTSESLLAFVGPLNRAMWKHEITTPKRRAAFLAQLAHESNELRRMEEAASGKAYEGDKKLGNTQPGDGVRYKGRGPIQLIGRANYRLAGEALGMKLEQNPEMVVLPEIGCQVAGWLWHTRKLNALADDGDFQQITRSMNGDSTGLKQREAYYRKALEVLKETKD